MAKKNKKRFDNPDYILARAERLFKSGNYRLAQLEFEKAGEVINSPEISQKIETCRRLAERARADELVKRAKKHLGKGNVHEALTCFVEANTVLKDGEIEKKIDQLRHRREGLEAERDAKRAEADGQYQKASELYQKAFEGQSNDLYALKTAHCLVRAGRHEEAVLIFERYRASDDWARYDYGFALARLGRFFECLQIWDRISSNDQGLKGQRQHVRALLHDALFERFERDRDYAGIYREGSYLLASEDDKSLRILVEYCKYAWIDELWKQERHDVIAGLLPDFSSPIDPAHLLLKAKNTFKLMEASKVIDDDLPMLWLTAIYGEAFKQLSCDQDKKEQVREKLLHLAGAMLTEAADAGQGLAKDLLTIWNIEKRRIKDLHRITNDDDNLICLVCTPQYAMRSGLSGSVLKFIKKHRKSFKNREDYLLLGSYYSPACKALLHMDMGRKDQAMACLRDITGKDDFTRYGVMRADFFLGMQWIEDGGNKSGRHFEMASDLFHISKAYENRLVQKTLRTEYLPELDRCFEALERIHAKRPSGPIKKAFSYVISKRAIAMYNKGIITDKVLSITLKKAMELDPKNKHAAGSLDHTRLALELGELDSAFEKHKMNRACNIALQSEYPEVREYFFESIEELLDFVDESYMTSKEALFMLDQIYSWCNRVDDTHPILEEIVEMMDEIRGENTNESIQGLRYRS